MCAPARSHAAAAPRNGRAHVALMRSCASDARRRVFYSLRFRYATACRCRRTYRLSSSMSCWMICSSTMPAHRPRPLQSPKRPFSRTRRRRTMIFDSGACALSSRYAFACLCETAATNGPGGDVCPCPLGPYHTQGAKVAVPRWLCDRGLPHKMTSHHLSARAKRKAPWLVARRSRRPGAIEERTPAGGPWSACGAARMAALAHVAGPG